jgi:hypothetical protein
MVGSLLGLVRCLLSRFAGGGMRGVSLIGLLYTVELALRGRNKTVRLFRRSTLP